MKIRIGFVSNSSSTSFVLLGWSISEEQAEKYVKDVIGSEISDDEDWKDAIWKHNDKNGIYYHGEEDEFFLGYMIAEASSDSQLEGKPVDLAIVLAKANKFGEKIGLIDPKIFVGTYAS